MADTSFEFDHSTRADDIISIVPPHTVQLPMIAPLHSIVLSRPL
jgi:hypothetical protein